MIPINVPKIGKEEVEIVSKVLESGFVTSGLGMGPMVKRFEESYAEFFKVKHAVAVNTGTAALHAAFLAADVKSGDEVILPAFTFVATAEAVALAGAKPVFADIDPLTYNLSAEAVEAAITEKTKAIVPVDIFGYPADIKAIRNVAQKKGLTVVEDAAQAHGAELYGEPAGAFADMACWSLYASKNMTTGEGGVVTTNDELLAEKLRMIRTHGEKEKYSSLMLGNNYRMSEIQAAIGIVQLKKLPSFLDSRRFNANRLSSILSKSSKLRLPREPDLGKHSWYLYTVTLENSSEEERNAIVQGLKTKGIGAEVYYSNPIHHMPYYRDNFGERDLPQTEAAAKKVFSLPIHPGVTEEQVNFIGSTLLELVES